MHCERLSTCLCIHRRSGQDETLKSRGKPWILSEYLNRLYPQSTALSTGAGIFYKEGRKSGQSWWHWTCKYAENLKILPLREIPVWPVRALWFVSVDAHQSHKRRIFKTPSYHLSEENNYESSAYQLLDPYWIAKCKDSIFENLSSILFKTLPNAHMTQELSAFKRASNKLYAVINISKLWQNYEKLLPSSQQSLNCRRAFRQHQH